jgi:sugar O-acyltransferase (sialic acid O-acetyltransferase NeuD family)
MVSPERIPAVINTIAVLGAGGFAREMYWHIKGAYPHVRLVFIDDVTNTTEILMAGERVPVVKDWKFDALYWDGPDRPPATCEHFVLGIGSPQAKREMVQKARAAGLTPAPTIVHPRAVIQGADCRIGVGGVITPGCVITTHVTIGDFVLLNLNTTVGHDAVLGDYVTCNPGCAISGNVTLGEGVVLGTGTVIREKISIAPGVVTGAQACVVKDIDEPNITVVGTPAKKLGWGDTIGMVSPGEIR